MNEILKEHLEKVNGTAGTSTGLDFLQLKHESGNYYAANTYLIALKELAALRARVGELEWERDELQGLVFDISGWLSNWEPDFTEDDEWEDVAKRIDAVLAKGAK